MATSQTPLFAVDCQPPSVRTREVASYVLYVGDTRRRSGWRKNSVATFASKKKPSASATGTAACARDSTMSDCARTASTTAWIAARPVSWRRNIKSSCSLLVLPVHPAGFPPQRRRQQLVEEAAKFAKQNGARIVEAYPMDPRMPAAPDAFVDRLGVCIPAGWVRRGCAALPRTADHASLCRVSVSLSAGQVVTGTNHVSRLRLTFVSAVRNTWCTLPASPFLLETATRNRNCF